MRLAGLTAVVAVIVTAAGTAVAIPYLRRRGVMDHPNHRTSHAVVTPRGAGIAFPVALAVAVGVVCLYGVEGAGALLVVAAIALVASGLGAADDFAGLTPRVRLAAQLVIGAVGSMALAIALDRSVAVVAAALVVGGVWCAASINAVNFMDGINGITGGFAIAAGVYVCVLGAHREVDTLVVTGAVLAGCGAGFLPFNVPRAAAFMGDSGSYFIGGLAASCAVLLALEYDNPLVAVPPFALYLVDTAITMVRRWRRGEDLFSPHRAHAYQRFVATGWSHSASAGLAFGVMATANVVAGSLVLTATEAPGAIASIVIVVVAIFLAVAFVGLADRVERMTGD